MALKLAFKIRVLCIAIGAAQIAACGPHKNGGQPNIGRFALNTEKDLVDFDHRLDLVLSLGSAKVKAPANDLSPRPEKT